MAGQLALVLVDSHSCSCRCFGAQLSQTILDKLHHHWPELCCKQHPAAARNRSWPAAEDATLVGKIIRWTTSLIIHDLRLSWTHGLPKHRHVSPTKQSMFFSKRSKPYCLSHHLSMNWKDYVIISTSAIFLFMRILLEEVGRCRGWKMQKLSKACGSKVWRSK